ncbi:hypothetical protein, partial [Deinococcus marmoris]|uniref:hypothetical protein n=1 Tax=Deinococcus marmoris TaxID=249408 RepID=UPI0039EE72FA
IAVQFHHPASHLPSLRRRSAKQEILMISWSLQIVARKVSDQSRSSCRGGRRTHAPADSVSLKSTSVAVVNKLARETDWKEARRLSSRPRVYPQTRKNTV